MSYPKLCLCTRVSMAVKSLTVPLLSYSKPRPPWEWNKPSHRMWFVSREGDAKVCRCILPTKVVRNWRVSCLRLSRSAACKKLCSSSSRGSPMVSQFRLTPTGWSCTTSPCNKGSACTCITTCSFGPRASSYASTASAMRLAKTMSGLAKDQHVRSWRRPACAKIFRSSSYFEVSECGYFSSMCSANVSILQSHLVQLRKHAWISGRSTDDTAPACRRQTES